MVSDSMGSTEGAANSSEEMALWLEQCWREPALSYQLNAQSLIRRGVSPFARAFPTPVSKDSQTPSERLGSMPRP